jgi:hypothetical protein
MERLFAAIDAEEARAPRRRRWFDLGGRISEFLSSLSPRTLAWSATAAVAILMQAATIAAVVVREQGSSSGPQLASAPSEGSYAVVRFAPQATANDITNFLGAYKATVVEGPLNMGGTAKRSVGHPAPRVHRASCLESVPGRQSRPPLALRTRAPRHRPS